MLEPFCANAGMITHIVITFYFTSCLLHPSLGHIQTKCAFIDNFEFAANKAFNVCIGMSMLFIGQFLEISYLVLLAHGVVMRLLLRMQLFCHTHQGQPAVYCL